MLQASSDTTDARLGALADNRRTWPCEELARALGTPSVAGRKRMRLAIDVGCGGDGADMVLLAGYADRVIGLPWMNEPVVAPHLRAHAPATTELMHWDLRTLPMSDDVADLVVDTTFIERRTWAAHHALLSDYRRVLRKGGRCFLYCLAHGTSLHGARRIDTFTYDKLPALGIDGTVCLPQAPALEAALSRAGLHPRSLRQLSRTFTDRSVTATYLIGEAIAV